MPFLIPIPNDAPAFDGSDPGLDVDGGTFIMELHLSKNSDPMPQLYEEGGPLLGGV